ncbi:unnamed protein product [Darwinula stevensoni]|uniref:Zinc finger PHD-type domain-containing protein n=1 Tax=Darwinula stevensoni TaxID=69355 RepID=A0A7R8X3U4_9CRUS|nr:unnamed protein product [Darwinula stevensoni]CAG0882915.1 unnamed protein product [Darwinula stevensoni]
MPVRSSRSVVVIVKCKTPPHMVVTPHTQRAVDVKPPKRRRTVEDFYAFCSYILEYENYPAMKNEEVSDMKQNSPSGSTGSLGTDTSYDSTESGSSHGSSTSSSPPQPRARRSQRMQKPKKSPSSGNGESDEEDDHDLVTCYCKKPYAGRPMIECSKCSTWVHLSCAKIRKSNIPEIFLCYKCKEPKHEERQRKEWN